MNEKYIQILEQAGIPESAIENSFSHAAIQRGIKYFEGNRAEITEIESQTGQDIRIHADVFGSLGYPYAIIVTLKVTRNYVSIIGECDCPVGFRCKHAVATLLQFAHANARAINQEGELDSADKEKVAELEVKLWLNEVQSSSSPAKETAQDSANVHNNVLLYLIRPTEDDKGMEVVSVTSRRLKKGGYGKNKVQSLEELVDGYATHINYEHTELDYEIAGLLYSMLGHGLIYRQNVYPLKGDIGELALEKLIETQRCFWLTQENREPLEFGHSREIKMTWEVINGEYKLDAQVLPEAQELFLLKHFFYIDTTTNQIGTITSENLSSEQIKFLLFSPPVPKKLAKKVSQTLIQRWPESELPMPVKPGIETIKIHEKPVADVVLHSIVKDDNRVHVLSLRFAYGEHVIQPENQNSETYGILQGKNRFIISRDSRFEQDCIESLNKLSFVSARKAGLTEVSSLDKVLMAESLSESVWLWHDFQNDIIPELKKQGWIFHIDDSFYLQVEEGNDWYGELNEDSSSDWFEISLGIEINGQNLNLLPSLVQLLVDEKNPQQLREHILSREYVMLPVNDDEKPRWIKLPANRVMGIFDTLVELYDTDALNSSGNLKLSKHQGLQIGALLNQPGMTWKGAGELQKLTKKLQDFKGIEQRDPPENLQTELRDYQRHGLNWLQFLREYQFNGILADDMGLGKTVQALAHLLYEKQHNKVDRPTLVIAPTSLMGNWKREAKRFTPDLKVLLLHGSERQSNFSKLEQYDVVLTTYSLFLRDKEVHSKQHYHYVILDESQNIKNARSKTAQFIFQLKSEHRLCMTGTPMENHLGELWSLFHFLMPGFMGPLEQFNRLFRNPIEKQGDSDRQVQLHNRIKPFLIRRTKEMVATELPEKTDMIRTVPLSGKQRDLYETVRLAMDEKVRDEISKKGLARSQIMILDALLKLRQVCCDPRLLSLSAAKDIHVSAKLDMLMEMVPEMVEEGRKILIFSQFVSMLDLIEDEIKKHPIEYTRLTGQTKNRDQAIEQFQNGPAQVFLISLKAGGVGLNLTAADTVIHYDPWWNPAVERQATDRAYRIGQDKPVFVYKLLTEETVEEKILQMQQSKQNLAEGLYQDKKKVSKQIKAATDQGMQLTQDELLDLLQPLRQ